MIWVMKPIPTGDGSDAVAENAFENNTEQNRAPTDKDGGGIEIRDRRTAFQEHTKDQAHRVNAKGQNQQ